MSMNKKLNNALDVIKQKVDMSLNKFTFTFPAAISKGYVYPPVEELGWTEGFRTGILWMLYELTGEEKYKNSAEIQCEIFKIREERDINLNHHDIGFLYSLSSVAAYKITHEDKYKGTALNAADKLCRRFREKGGFLQAWGDMDKADNYRLIVDCLLNIPLLFWASEVSGNERYEYIAKTHLKTAVKNIIRDDFTTYHTYFFDPQTGEPLRGATAQGYSDDSCWSRGQAWAMYGLAIAYSYTQDAELIPLFNGVTKYFIEHLPSNYVPYWDLIFTDGNEPRDTSAAAVAVCAILHMNKFVPNPEFMDTADKMLESLMDNYSTNAMSYCDGLLTDGMYSRKTVYSGNRECTTWGDYFYMEAITRKLKDWEMYW